MASKQQIIDKLNDIRAAEQRMALIYRRAAQMVTGPYRMALVEELQEHADDETGHADLVMEQIMAMDGQIGEDVKTIPVWRSLDEILTGLEQLEYEGVRAWQELKGMLDDNDPFQHVIEDVLVLENSHWNDVKQWLRKDYAEKSVSMPYFESKKPLNWHHPEQQLTEHVSKSSQSERVLAFHQKGTPLTTQGTFNGVISKLRPNPFVPELNPSLTIEKSDRAIDLIKHKYTKRTGGPGNYKYEYGIVGASEGASEGASSPGKALEDHVADTLSQYKKDGRVSHLDLSKREDAVKLYGAVHGLTDIRFRNPSMSGTKDWNDKRMDTVVKRVIQRVFPEAVPHFAQHQIGGVSWGKSLTCQAIDTLNKALGIPQVPHRPQQPQQPQIPGMLPGMPMSAKPPGVDQQQQIVPPGMPQPQQPQQQFPQTGMPQGAPQSPAGMHAQGGPSVPGSFSPGAQNPQQAPQMPIPTGDDDMSPMERAAQRFGQAMPPQPGMPGSSMTPNKPPPPFAGDQGKPLPPPQTGPERSGPKPGMMEKPNPGAPQAAQQPPPQMPPSPQAQAGNQGLPKPQSPAPPAPQPVGGQQGGGLQGINPQPPQASMNTEPKSPDPFASGRFSQFDEEGDDQQSGQGGDSQDLQGQGAKPNPFSGGKPQGAPQGQQQGGELMSALQNLTKLLQGMQSGQGGQNA